MPEWLCPSVPDEEALNQLPQSEQFSRETKSQEVFHRLAGCWTYWGWKNNCFNGEKEARIYFDEMLYMPRVVSGFDLTNDLHLKLGGSALMGPNATGMNTQTTIYGGDMQLKWQPQAGQGFPFFIWDSEFLYRDYETPLFEDALEDWGWYTQGLYGFAPRWVGGLRVEYADGAHGLDQEMDDLRSERYIISPNISWMTSKFSQLRLQYNFDVLESRDHEPQHGLFVQWNFQFGSPYVH